MSTIKKRIKEVEKLLTIIDTRYRDSFDENEVSYAMTVRKTLTNELIELRDELHHNIISRKMRSFIKRTRAV